MSTEPTVSGDPELSDARRDSALTLLDLVEMNEPLHYGIVEAREIASEWHGGQGSALYSLSSTGMIHGADHRDRLCVEIEHDLTSVANDMLQTAGDSRTAKLDVEHERLTALLAWVTAHDFKPKYPSSVWSAYGHRFIGDSEGPSEHGEWTESCLACGAIFHLVTDDDDSIGRYVDVHGGEPMECTRQTDMTHGYPWERDGGWTEHNCNCLACDS